VFLEKSHLKLKIKNDNLHKNFYFSEYTKSSTNLHITKFLFKVVADFEIFLVFYDICPFLSFEENPIE